MFGSAAHTRTGSARPSLRCRSILIAALGLFAALASSAKLGVEYQMVLGNPTPATSSASIHEHYLIQRDQYAMDYNDNRRVPNWVSWSLSSTDYGNVSRTNNWAADPGLPYAPPSSFFVVSTSTYNGGAVYDRGHMCPSADRTGSLADNWTVFYMSNILPQASRNNQGLWNDFEQYCRGLTTTGGGNEVLIICGPRSFGGATVGPSNTAIPDHVWKIVVVVPNGAGTALERIDASTRVIALDTPNTNSVSSTWSDYVTSVASIEAATGYTFFSALPSGLAATLKAKVDGQVVTGAPTITTQPAAQSTTLGGSVTFTVAAIGNPTLQYQWRKNATAIDGAINPSLTIEPVALGDAGSYSVVVSNSVGAATSAAATLSIVGPPVIVTAPFNRTARAGDAVTFTVAATGTPPLAYEWFHGLESLGTTTVPELSLPDVQADDAGDYAVSVSNAQGAVLSATATLTVEPSAPVITAEPASQSVSEGATVAFSVSAKGTNPLAFQWYKDGQALTNGGRVSGATSATLTLAGVAIADSGSYQVAVINTPDGSTVHTVQSEMATLDVVAVPPQSDLSWNFTLATPTGLPANVTGGTISHGNNLGSPTLLESVSVSGSYTGASAGNNAACAAVIGALNKALGGSAYFEFTLTPAADTKLSILGMKWGSRSTGTGPQAYSVFTSADDYSSAVATGTLISDKAWRYLTPTFTRNTATATTGSPITVRIYGHGNTGTTNTNPGTANWRIDDLTVAIGTVTAPTITLSPASQNAELGSTVTLGVTAAGTAPFTYQWRKDGTPLATGGTGATLELVDIHPADTASYDVVVTNEAGSATSTAATLAVVRTYAAWIGSWLLSGDTAAATADPDGDGLPNLVEFALGLAPTAPNTTGLPALTLEGGEAVFRFTRPRIATGVTYLVQTSTDLLTWSPAAVSPSAETSTPDTETLVVRFPAASPRLFARLAVTQP